MLNVYFVLPAGSLLLLTKAAAVRTKPITLRRSARVLGVLSHTLGVKIKRNNQVSITRFLGICGTF